MSYAVEPRPLVEAAEAYAAVLARHGEVVDFDISGVDRTGIPVTSCSLLVGDRFTHHGNGYGATPEAARLGGLGELAEGVLMGSAVAALRADAVEGSWREVVAREGADRVVDPRLLGLVAGSSWTPERPLVWVWVERVRTGEPVLAPLDHVASDAADLVGVDPLVPPVTNGLGAGLDVARATAHGIGEVLQRHTNGLRFRALDRLSPVVDPAGLPAGVLALVERLRAVGIEPVLKHAASELGVCSTYVMGIDADPGTPVVLSACGEAAHPDPAVSLTKALLEYANSRARKAFCFGDPALARGVAPSSYLDRVDRTPVAGRESEAMRAWHDLPLAELRALVEPVRDRTVGYGELVAAAGPAASQVPAEVLAGLLADLADHDVLAATTTQDGVVAAKVLVTGLEVEVLSHGRLGEAASRASLEADLDLVRVQDGPSGSHVAEVHLTDEARERLGGRVWWSWDVAGRTVGALYPLYREPPRHTVAV